MALTGISVDQRSYVRIDDNCEDVARILRQHPRWLVRARKSALASIGNDLRKKIKRQYETQAGWPRPIRRGPVGVMRGKVGMNWLARFVRYRVTPSRLVLWPTKDDWTSKGKKRRYKKRPSRWLNAVTKKHEYGRRIRVTRKMRRWFAAHGMPLKKTTRWLNIPQRSAYHAIWEREEASLPHKFEQKFLNALRRYESGMTREEWDIFQSVPLFSRL